MVTWLQDIESFERVSQDDFACRLVLRLAQLSREGRLGPFVEAVTSTEELDEPMREAIAELAQDETFLFAVEDYLGRTAVLH